ncbi:MAG: hypothetical protein ABEI13_01735, partial [Candidatus Paceibacteria bacterium]
LAVNQEIEVIGSTGNDGTYTINTLNYDSTNDETDITVDENISDSTADGQIIPGGQAIFKTWEKDKTDEVINKVKVEATNSNGATVTGSAKNQDMIDKFGVKFKKVKIPYVESTSEADRIAKSYLVPGKDDQGNDITEPPESGTVKTAVFSDNIVNDSMQIVDNTRNIDDTFTVVQQRNFWPEGVSELEFEFEKENLEEAARESENLRDERARLYPDNTTDVGNQSVTTNDALSNTAKTGGVGDSNDRGDNLSNVAKTGGVGDSNDRGDNLSNVAKVGGVNQIGAGSNIFGTFDTDSFSSVNVPSSSWEKMTSGSASASTNSLYHHLVVNIDGSDNSGFNFFWAIEQSGSIVAHGYSRIETDTDSHTITGQNGNLYWQKDRVFSLEQFADDQTLIYDLHIKTSGSASPTLDGDLSVAPVNHDHPDDIDTDNNSMGLTDDIDTDNQAMGLTDDIATDDNFHGGGTGDDQHGGSTESNVNVTTAQEDKTNR